MTDQCYRDSTLAPSVRAELLLAEMTLEEKVAQLAGVWVFRLFEDNAFSPSRASEVLSAGMGHIARPAGGSGYGAAKAAELVNTIQRVLVEETRLGIPAIMHDECLAGFLMKGSPLYPQAIGLASTWDPSVIRRMTESLRRQMRAVGIHQGLSPVLDIARDPRWGRVEETLGEDPYLVAAMGSAYIQGLQGDEPRHGVAATVKHFAGYSASDGGLNMAPSRFGEREFREVYLFPFEAVIRESGAMSVMNSYSEIDGVPCAMSKRLLTEILREEWGFEGVVVADYEAILRLKTHHLVAADEGKAGRLALEAGLDLELPDPMGYGEQLIAAVQDGTFDEAIVDRSVLRVLRQKFSLGLFEAPYVGIPEEAPKQRAQDRALALDLARKSMVLLTNDGTLPFDPTGKTIAVIGPSADEARNMLSDYAYPAHMELMFAMAGEGFIRPLVNLDEIKESVQITTVLDAVRAQVGDESKVIYAKGCEIRSDDRSEFNEAVKAAQRADLAIVVVGDRSGLTKECTCGETRDCSSLKLPGVQEELILELARTDTPVVLLLATGRPYVLTPFVDQVQAILEMWLPGESGGEAAAEIVFGETNPSGKLPITFPRSVGQIPIHYAHKPSGSHSEWWHNYVDESVDPLFPFGHGCTYSEFRYSDLRIRTHMESDVQAVEISLEVTNASSRMGEEIVQCYIRRAYASVTRPVQELVGFVRVPLESGAARRVIFHLPLDVLAFYDRTMQLVVETGSVDVLIGPSSSDIRLTGAFEIEGQTRVIKGPRAYFSTAGVA